MSKARTIWEVLGGAVHPWLTKLTHPATSPELVPSPLTALSTFSPRPQVLVNLNDINDNCPTFPRPYEGPFDVTEGQPGPRVWTFLAHDGDSGPSGQVEYSIVAGDPLGEQGGISPASHRSWWHVPIPLLLQRSTGRNPAFLTQELAVHFCFILCFFVVVFYFFSKQSLATGQGGGGWRRAGRKRFRKAILPAGCFCKFSLSTPGNPV